MPIVPDPDDAGGRPTVYASSFQGCARVNSNKYWYDKVLVVAEDDQLRERLKTYIEGYMLPAAGFPPGWSVGAYATQEEGFADYAKDERTPYCFGLTFRKFDPATNDYEIEFHWAKEDVPDTNQPAFNDQIKAPDLLSWDQWKNTGATAVYPYLTEFIARWKNDVPFDQPTALYNQEMGYSPMMSTKFENVSPLALAQLI